MIELTAPETQRESGLEQLVFAQLESLLVSKDCSSRELALQFNATCNVEYGHLQHDVAAVQDQVGSWLATAACKQKVLSVMRKMQFMTQCIDWQRNESFWPSLNLGHIMTSDKGYWV